VNIRSVVTLVVAVATVNIAATSRASADAPTNAVWHGEIDAVVTFCNKIYPAGTSKYHRLRNLILGPSSDLLKDESANSPEYRQAFNSVRTSLASFPHDQAIESCKAIARL